MPCWLYGNIKYLRIGRCNIKFDFYFFWFKRCELAFCGDGVSTYTVRYLRSKIYKNNSHTIQYYIPIEPPSQSNSNFNLLFSFTTYIILQDITSNTLGTLRNQSLTARLYYNNVIFIIKLLSIKTLKLDGTLVCDKENTSSYNMYTINSIPT